MHAESIDELLVGMLEQGDQGSGEEGQFGESNCGDKVCGLPMVVLVLTQRFSLRPSSCMYARLVLF